MSECAAWRGRERLVAMLGETSLGQDMICMVVASGSQGMAALVGWWSGCWYRAPLARWLRARRR